MFIGHVELMKAVKFSVYLAAAVGRGVDHAGEVRGSVYQVVGGSLFNCVEVVPHIHYIAKSIGSPPPPTPLLISRSTNLNV